jgi:hypothetical protein
MNKTFGLQILDIYKDSRGQGITEFINSFKSLKAWLIGSCGALFATKDKLYPQFSQTFPLLLPNHPYFKAMLFFVFAFLALLVYYQIKQFLIHSWRKYVLSKRESVYGNAIVLLSQGYAKIHKSRGKELSIEDVKSILSEFCDKIRRIYEFKTKAKCSVSIKTFLDLNSENNDITFETRVVNLIRDSEGKERYANSTYDSKIHTIANNTCYQRIISKFFSGKFDDMYFLSNDIPSIEDYENSSFELFPKYTTEIRNNKDTRRSEYPLEYRSELVVSITSIIKEDKTTFPILGFLCVDCELEKVEVFNSKYDVPLLQGVSDGLYDFIKYNLYK